LTLINHWLIRLNQNGKWWRAEESELDLWKKQGFLHRHQVQKDFGVHPASYATLSGILTQGYSVWSMKLITNPHQNAELENKWSLTAGATRLHGVLRD
jgi:hypothetical protein